MMTVRSKIRQHISKENRMKLKKCLFIKENTPVNKYIIESIIKKSDILYIAFKDKINIDEFILMLDKTNDQISIQFDVNNNVLSFDPKVFESIKAGKHRLRILFNNHSYPIQMGDSVDKKIVVSEDATLYSNINSNLTVALKIHEFFIEKYSKECTKQLANNEQARVREYYASKYDDSPIKDNVILYEVRDGTSFTDSPRSIFNYLISHPDFADFEHIISYDKNHLQDFPKDLQCFSNVKLVERESFEYLDALLSAKYLFNNSTFHSYFTKREGQVYINTWHGTPLKHMGDAYVQDMMNPSNVRRNFLMADFILSPNSFTSRVFLEDYKLNYLWDGVILENGLPRNELSQYNSKNDIISELLNYGLKINKELDTYIYMPTWQGKNVNDANNTIGSYSVLIEEIVKKKNHKYNFLIKVHPFLYDKAKKDVNLSKYLIPNFYDSNEIFKISSALVTDYSSVFFDYLVTKKPIIFYNWDSEFYRNDRGSYFEESDLPGPSIKNISSLLEVLENVSFIPEDFKQNYRRFQEEFVFHDDEKMLEEYVEAIFNNRFEHLKVVQPLQGKKKLLFHAGALMDNGITSSFINLVNQIDKEKYDITVFLHDSNNLEVQNNWKKLPTHVRKMFKPGLPIYKFEENVHDRYLKNETPKSNIDRFFPEAGYKREVSRLFGNSQFDVSIDFSGYSYFWAKYMVAVDAETKICYMHNDLYAETNRKVDGKYPLRKDLLGMFSLYSKFDYLASVSEALMEVNREKLSYYISNEQMIYIENSINIEHILHAPKDKFSAIEIRKDKREYLKDKEILISIYSTLDDLENDRSYSFIVQATDIIRSLSSTTFCQNPYTYITVNNQPLGWVEQSSFGDSKLGIKLKERAVKAEGKFKVSQGYLFEGVEERVFNKSFKREFIKNEKVEIHSIFNFFNADYYQIKFENKTYLTNSKNITVTELTSKEFCNEYFYYPSVIESFGNHAKIPSGGEEVTIYKDKTLKDNKKIIFNLPIFYQVEDIQFIKNGYYAKIKNDKKVYGWISVKDIKFDTEFYPPTLKTEVISCSRDSLITFDIYNDKYILKDSKDKEVKISKVKIQNGNYLGQIYTNKGIQHEFYIENSLYYLSDEHEYFSLWNFKNYRIILDIAIKGIKGEIFYLKPGDYIFVLRKRMKSGVKVIDALYKEQFISFIENSDFVFSTEDSSYLSHIVSKTSFSSFVTLKGNDSIWDLPYDKTLGSTRVGKTEMFKNIAFLTKNKYVTYLGTTYVDLYFRDNYLGVVNVNKINVTSYSIYKECLSNQDENIIEEILPYNDRVESSSNNFNSSSKFYITEKEFSGLVVPKKKEAEVYKNKEAVIEDVSEKIKLPEQLFSSKILTFSHAKYFSVEIGEEKYLICIDDVKVLESNYLVDLPKDIRKKINPDDIVFTTMGRLSPEKNQLSLLKATKMLIDSGRNIKVLVLGKGPLEEELKAQIKKLKLENNFFLAGQFEYPFNLVKQSDFFVFPSIWEGQGMVLLEALVLGKKVMTSNIPTSVDVLKNGKFGLIVPGTDEEVLMRGMLELLNHVTKFSEFNGFVYNKNALDQFYKYINMEK
ncbi:CDP-glycerol glycerophosphotransferase family protein [Lactococcus formosensis]|uniref:CDP-glycerol glycerophosphotransferase family protein n=1 Tax=Lactococcus formosensis TaxID=1281486 RepID=UPI00037CF9DE|nr:CDP-glycerol glycerophosphotransferase family protein [Lactococcus formosensis]MDG6113887.1 CDP-glycerol glycerophosphotransferase family protein [Lactococcus formosensis]MDG6115868.1 CDP-glycerol glycerophosphotransferase family protein [Lactococcus formosensis]MDG6122122.1 CDP-glycerol glycerophosphotransferase family protein [Lactococcus formosensis]MDG6128573.1 CDP-glycerol glycerophosphotransferase family protein [Lactococcus formosensis]MDG6130696.1 CDP-glycerol glycerophosphotransfer